MVLYILTTVNVKKKRRKYRERESFPAITGKGAGYTVEMVPGLCLISKIPNNTS